MRQRKLIVHLTLVLVLLATIYSSFFLVSVEGYSMYPTYASGDTLLATKVFLSVSANEVIVFKHEGEFVIKRVKRVDGEGRIFLLGDNPINSEDSRDYGPISISDVYGKVIFAKEPSIKFREEEVSLPNRKLQKSETPDKRYNFF
jgi:phage repressor protein C with HTH and peptisase S24 domain